ncbi:MAG TPA: FtsX-like permease family protein [Candidatus Angelobacter sp.]|nr:FtsX-like permease family protein [Candidatus Angelobacter sp.]
MSRPRLMLRMLLKAVWVRKDRTLTALLSIAVVATLTTAILTVYAGLDAKLNQEFRSFGANAIVTDANGTITPEQVEKIRNTLGDKGEIVPVAYAVVSGPSGSRMVVAGANLSLLAAMNSWWSITKEYSQNPNAMLGSRVAETLSAGQSASPTIATFQITYGGRSADVRAGAVFRSGSPDDNRIYLDLSEFTKLTGVTPNTVLLRIDGSPADIEKQVGTLAASLPHTEVKIVRQITSTQTAVLGRTRSIVLAACLVVVILIVLCMVATLTGSVLERRKDFAVMKALGASNTTVNLLFAGEATLMSVMAALGGFFAGTALAFWIGKVNFGTAISPRLSLLFPVLSGSILVALLASTAPLRLLRAIQPASILRGE